jgi:hypothetical protein
MTVSLLVDGQTAMRRAGIPKSDAALHHATAIASL